jgi:hypothetical protein
MNKKTLGTLFFKGVFTKFSKECVFDKFLPLIGKEHQKGE